MKTIDSSIKKLSQNEDSELRIINFTEDDLAYENRNKPFEEISLKDFNYNVSEAAKAFIIFFIDTRKKSNIRNLFGLNSNNQNKRIKVLKLY